MYVEYTNSSGAKKAKRRAVVQAKVATGEI